MKTRNLITAVCVLSAMALTFGFTASRYADIPVSPVSADADSLDLKKYAGKVVVMNFWASWSKTSRSENKNLVRLYQKYKLNPKVVFISVSLDTDQANWKNAIAEDELSWPDQVCDFKKYDSPIATKYKVNTLPKFLLADKQGHIAVTSAKMIDIENSIDTLLK